MSDIEVPRIADTETVQADVMCAGLVAPSPRQKRKTTPAAWAAKADEWFAHVAACPYCSQFYEPAPPPDLETGP